MIKMASDMKMHMKQSGVIEFLHVEKTVPNDVHGFLLNIYGDQTVGVRTVRQWVVYFSSGDTDSGSPSLVQIFLSRAYRLLFIAGENA